MKRDRSLSSAIPEKSPRSEAAALAYVNSRGQTYYLHEGTTKTGATRYFFARARGPGAIANLPSGYEVTESINGVVSVRRIPTSPPLVPPEHVEHVQAGLLRQPHLSRYRAEARKDEIIVYEPQGVNVQDLARMGGFLLGNMRPMLPDRYVPVMKFVRCPKEGPDHYVVHRMTYRGDGGWSYPLSSGRLGVLLGQYLKHIGKESFFELY